MKKIRLDLEALDVQSFTTVGVLRPHGTVWGAESEPAQTNRCSDLACNGSGMCAPSGMYCEGSWPAECLILTAGQDTCQATCPATWAATCQDCKDSNTCPGVLGC